MYTTEENSNDTEELIYSQAIDLSESSCDLEFADCVHDECGCGEECGPDAR